MRASEDPQDRAQSALLDALIAAAEGDDAGTLAHAREVLAAIPAIGVRSEFVVQSWSPAIRAARALGDADAVEELLALLDAYPVGHLTPLLRAERDLARARLAGDAGDPGADELFRKAVAAHRRVANPYYLAQALLDHAEFLAAAGRPDRAETPSPRPGPSSKPWAPPTVVDRADQISRTARSLESAVSCPGDVDGCSPTPRCADPGDGPGEDPTAGRARVDAGPRTPISLRYGGHTSCVAITPSGDGDPTLLLDAGTGIRSVTELLVGTRIPRIDPAQPPALGPRLWSAVLRRRRPPGQCGRRVSPGAAGLLRPRSVWLVACLRRPFPSDRKICAGSWTFRAVEPGVLPIAGFEVDCADLAPQGRSNLRLPGVRRQRLPRLPARPQPRPGAERRALELIAGVDVSAARRAVRRVRASDGRRPTGTQR